MSHAYLDENGVATIITISNSDGSTIVRNLIDPSTNRLMVNDGTSGTDQGNNFNNAYRDENDRPVWIAASSADGFTPIEVYSDPLTQRLLINSN